MDVEDASKSTAPSVPTVDHDAERRLCLKFDLRILPVLAIMYLFNALDKGNLGNAQTNGLSNDLHLKPNQYNLIVSLFFIPYVLFSPPLALLAKHPLVGPSRALPAMMLLFGCMTLCTAAAHAFSSLLALRILLGAAEAAFFPTVVYYLTTFYRRAELARRLAIFYAASNVANAFSGLLAFAVFRIRAGLPSWRYLFLIEGGATVLASGVAWAYLPRGPGDAGFLSEAEIHLALHRVRVDSSSDAEDGSFKDSLAVFAHPTTYAFLLAEICLGVPLQSVALFLPQIIQRLGYLAVKTNLATVAPNVTGAAMLLLLAFSSDYFRIRFPFILLGYLFTLSGFVVYALVDGVRAAYFATFMMCWGTSAPSVLLSAWYNNNVAHDGRRILLTSVAVPLANLMGLVSGNIFRQADAPVYLPALITTACFGAAGACVTLSLGVFMMLDNRRRDRRTGVKLRAVDVPTWKLRDGPRVPDFRWFL